MSWILNIKNIFFLKRKQNCDLIPPDNFIYQNFKGKKLILEIIVGAVWLYQVIDVALFL